MRYILSGGGTGGHIYPALAIGRGIFENDKDAQVYYVGKKDSLEEELVAKSGLKISFYPVKVEGLPRKSINLDSFKSIIELSKGIKMSKKLLKTFKPDIVIATGGYVCAPISLAAQMAGIPTVIQEQNAYPGKTNKLLSKKAKKIFLNFEEAEKYFDKSKIVVTGNPIREEFKDISSEHKDMAFNTDHPFVLSFGGSGGQESTNDAMIEMLKNHDIDFNLVHITGKVHYENFIKDLGDYNNDKVTILEYSHDIPVLLNRADVVIASSSAMTLAEISAVGKASILIPKSYTAGDHQRYNAKTYEKAGASIVIDENDLNGEILLEKIENIIKDEKYRKELGANAKKLGNPEGVNLIVEEIDKITGRLK